MVVWSVKESSTALSALRMVSCKAVQSRPSAQASAKHQAAAAACAGAVSRRGGTRNRKASGRLQPAAVHTTWQHSHRLPPIPQFPHPPPEPTCWRWRQSGWRCSPGRRRGLRRRPATCNNMQSVVVKRFSNTATLLLLKSVCKPARQGAVQQYSHTSTMEVLSAAAAEKMTSHAVRSLHPPDTLPQSPLT